MPKNPDFSNLDQHLRERRYETLAEKHAYFIGYGDGAYGEGPNENCDPHRNWLHAYMAGWHDGRNLT